MPFTLIRGAELYAPASLGQKDVLLCNDKIIAIDDSVELSTSVDVTVFDAAGKIMCPGFVDSLTHITGGGGEGGFATRTPEMKFSDAISGGVTTVTGALGTDAVCRTHFELIAKVKALKEEGLSAWFYTGNYHIPAKTLTGSVQQDIMLLEECLGVGEVAIADHRGSQPDWRTLAQLAAEARVGGMCGHKAGVVMVHVGSGDDRLQLLFDVAQNSQIPLSQFYPTHINRNAALLEHGVQFNKAGGTIDFTASTTEQLVAAGDIRAADALAHALAAGADEQRITFSTDGHASLPHFNADGVLESLQVGEMTSLHDALVDAVKRLNLPLTTVLRTITENPARVLRLPNKGQLITGKDADLCLLDANSLAITDVWALGRHCMSDGQLIRRGTFD